jgi:hypothetical protein
VVTAEGSKCSTFTGVSLSLLPAWDLFLLLVDADADNARCDDDDDARCAFLSLFASVLDFFFLGGAMVMYSGGFLFASAFHFGP